MEKENGGVLDDISQTVSRTVGATKASRRTVERIMKEARNNEEIQVPVFASPKKRKRPSPVTDFFDDFNIQVLRRTVLRFYERKEIPTIEKIHEELKNNLSYSGGRETLRKILIKIGFQYASADGRRFLMERSDVTRARSVFLREMRRHTTSGKNIVYLDETWVNQNYTVSKCWIEPKAEKATGVRVPTGKGARLIVLHAGSQQGFIPGAALVFQAKNHGDYHDQMNSETFEKWFRMQLLPNILPSSIIVMDNASYHSRKIHKPPTAASNKASITEWLEQKGVTVPQGLLKADLLHLVSRHTTDGDTNYVIDKIAAEHGHRVVRLPPYHCQYNPIEMIWAQVKGYVSKRNNFKLADLKPLVNEALNNVTTENWRKAVAHAEKLQDDDTQRDVVIDHFIDSFIITLTSSDEE